VPFTTGRGVDVVYDSVGQSTFEGSLASLRPRGMFVTFGNSSGPVPAFAPLILSQKGSLYMTRPTLAHYTLTAGRDAFARGRSVCLGDAGSVEGSCRRDVQSGTRQPMRTVRSKGARAAGKILLLPKR
jgi:NADPH2:quinone reductase